jgi:solute carrier family 13 (sodium-dependent dicarboxylate transporter), member 2/3/5
MTAISVSLRPESALPWPRIAAWATIAGALACAWVLPGLGFDGRLTLSVFVVCIALWTLTNANDAAVALGAVAVLVMSGTIGEERLHQSLSSELVWLLIGAFVIAAVLRENGAAQALALRILSRTGSVRTLFYAVALVVAATAFAIPSTSARAAILLPVFLALVPAVGSPAIVRALGLLFPTVILLSAFGALTGAGAHVVALEAIMAEGGPALSYAQWTLLALPVALVTVLLATGLILRTFLTSGERGSPVARQVAPAPVSEIQARALACAALTVAAWMTQDWHGAGLAVTALGGALLLTVPAVSGVAFKTAVKKVEWELILFLAAAMALGHALIDTGVAGWAAAGPGMLAAQAAGSKVAIALAVTLIALAAHLVITSRTARATVLIPSIAIPFASLGADPAFLILLTVAGTGFCQSFSVSAKPVALFAQTPEAGITPQALLRLSLALFPVVALVLIAAAFFYWPVLGFGG